MGYKTSLISHLFQSTEKGVRSRILINQSFSPDHREVAFSKQGWPLSKRIMIVGDCDRIHASARTCKFSFRTDIIWIGQVLPERTFWLTHGFIFNWVDQGVIRRVDEVFWPTGCPLGKSPPTGAWWGGFWRMPSWLQWVSGKMRKNWNADDEACVSYSKMTVPGESELTPPIAVQLSKSSEASIE